MLKLIGSFSLIDYVNLQTIVIEKSCVIFSKKGLNRFSKAY